MDNYVKTHKKICKHAIHSCKHGAKVRHLLEALKKIDLTKIRPPKPTDYEITQQDGTKTTTSVTNTDLKIWEKKIDLQVKRELSLKENLETYYSIIIGQCTEALTQEMKGKTVFETIDSSSDSIGLLNLIRGKMFKTNDQQYLPVTLHEALHQLYLLSQQKGQPNFEYYQRFQNNIDLITYLGASFGFHDSLIKENLAKIGKTLADADNTQKLTVKYL